MKMFGQVDFWVTCPPDKQISFVISSPVSIEGNSGPMVLHQCLAVATCMHSKSIWVCLLFTEFDKNPEKQTEFKRSWFKLHL